MKTRERIHTRISHPPARERALQILQRYGALTPREFAWHMWPNSPGWKAARRHDGIAGAHGAGLIMSAGAFLGRMRDDGLVYQTEGGAWSVRS